jgi:large subunit ribosomal protein L25
MQHIAIEVKPRPERLTKGERKRLRNDGYILASVYGKDIQGVPVTMRASDLARVFRAETGINTLIDLPLNGKQRVVKVEHIEQDPITRHILHVGLHEIKANEPQKATIAVELVGEPDAVRDKEGILEPGAATVEVKCLPERAVPSLALDVSGMKINDVLRAGDLELPGGFELLTDPDTPLVSLHVLKAMVTEEEATGEVAREETAEEEEEAAPAA